MPEYNKLIQSFLQATCRQIRFKSIHKSIIDELSDHIEEQKCEYIKQGFDEETAVIKTLDQMGDPVLVGKQLDMAHRPRTEWSIISLAAVLVVIGGFVQFFLSRVSTNNTDAFSDFLIYAPIGILAFTAIYFFDYTLLGRYSKLAYFMLFAASIAGFVILNRVNGAYIHVYYSSLLFIPAFAGIIYGLRNKGYLGIIASGGFYCGAAFICIIGRELTSLILLTLSCLIILTIAVTKGYFGGSKKVSLAIVYIPVVLVTLISGLSLFMSPYRMNRLLIIVNPQLDPRGGGWQHLMVKRLIAASRPFGEAVLDGNIANIRIDRLLPFWSTDFTLTYIIARLGYVVGFTIVAIIFVLLVRMFNSVNKQKNMFGFLISYAACIAISGQFILCVLSNFGLIAPFPGTLTFITFGGTGFVTNMILAGIVLSVYRRTDLVSDKLQNSICNRRLFTFEDGKIIIDLGLKFRKL